MPTNPVTADIGRPDGQSALCLSVFEQSAGAKGRSHNETLAETLALARYAEDLGYDGFWLGEHHDNPAFLGSAPEILMAAAATTTRRIRIGSAGIMLLHYSPYKVAEQALTLSSIAPGRIELGLGRSKGHGEVSALLEGKREADDFTDAAREVLQHIEGSSRPSGPRAYPRPCTLPSPHVLATSSRGAASAAALGLPLIFNYSDGGAQLREALAVYRERFRPSRWLATPRVALSVWALAAEEAREAWHLFQSRIHWRLRYMRGERVAMIPPDEAARSNAADDLLPQACAKHERYFIGEAGDVSTRLATLVKEAGAAELLLSTWAHDPAAKRRSIRLIIEAMRTAPLAPVQQAAL